MERIADVENRQGLISAESTAFVDSHPQLKQLLHDFVTTVLASKPTNVHLFARDYFASMINESSSKATTGLETLEDQEDEAEEEALMKGEIHTQQQQ